ncbi:MAG: hypothetical protein QOF77_949 [Solirubrobacteraceae bacterium]|jgi:hypothetical protein|nr:hypothetical protein [Solirubrobacteraceae bacterium]
MSGMSQFEDGDLPPELSYVADQLRSHRYEASALELDQAKTRILKQASGPRAAKGGAMRKRTLLTAMIMFAAIGTGSAAALAVGGASLPSIPLLHTAKPSKPAPNAAVAMYGNHPSSVSVVCIPASFSIGKSTTCTATVTAGEAPTGIVSFASNTGDPFSPATCTLQPIGGPQARCSVTFTPRHQGTIKVYAHYSGDAINAPSNGSTFVTVGPRTTSDVSVSCTAAQVGKASTCTAIVTGNHAPTGTVLFTSNRGGTSEFTPNPCTLHLIGGNQAECTVTFTPLRSGSTKIYVNYSGDANNAASHNSTTITVAPSAGRVSVSCAAAKVGTPTSCTATVTGASTSPTGTVLFTTNRDGTVPFTPNPCTLHSVGGSQAACTVTYTPLRAGPTRIYVNYSGDANNPRSHGHTDITVAP